MTRTEAIGWIVVGANIASIAWAITVVVNTRRVMRHYREVTAAVREAGGWRHEGT